MDQKELSCQYGSRISALSSEACKKSRPQDVSKHLCWNVIIVSVDVFHPSVLQKSSKFEQTHETVKLVEIDYSLTMSTSFLPVVFHCTECFGYCQCIKIFNKLDQIL